jgi:hypothetical protein
MRPAGAALEDLKRKKLQARKPTARAKANKQPNDLRPRECALPTASDGQRWATATGRQEPEIRKMTEKFARNAAVPPDSDVRARAIPRFAPKWEQAQVGTGPSGNGPKCE